MEPTPLTQVEYEREVRELFGIPVINHEADADVFRYWPTELLDQDITIATAISCRAKHWKNMRLRCGDFLYHFLAKHRLGPKDGMMFLPGELAGDRRKMTEVLALYFAVFDLDKGQPASVVVRKLEAANAAFLAYSSHSHEKTISRIPVLRVRTALGLGMSDPTDAQVQTYMREHEHIWPDVAQTASVIGTCEDEMIVNYRIRHAPIEKYRIVLPLAKPFVTAEFNNAREAARAWENYLCRIAELYELQFDRACLDLSRAFYTPRHRSKRSFFVCLGGEHPTDLASFAPYRKPRRQRAPRPSTCTAAPPDNLHEFLRDHGDEFDVVGWLQSIDWDIRIEHSEDMLAIECPNDEAHNNAGDPLDAACVAINPAETEIGRAVITCRHEHCRGLKTRDFMAMIVDQLAQRTGTSTDLARGDQAIY